MGPMAMIREPLVEICQKGDRTENLTYKNSFATKNYISSRLKGLRKLSRIGSLSADERKDVSKSIGDMLIEEIIVSGNRCPIGNMINAACEGKTFRLSVKVLLLAIVGKAWFRRLQDWRSGGKHLKLRSEN